MKKLQDLFTKGLYKFVRLCPKTGKVVGIAIPKNAYLLLFPVCGILAIIWFLIRTLPKPTRAAYPCQRAAAGIGIAFITWLVGLGSSLLAFKKLKQFLRKFPAPVITATAVVLCCGLGLGVVFTMDSFISPSKTVYADWNPSDLPNTPLGTPQGINPGRVTWMYNPDATANTVTGSWWQSGNTNQQVVKDMTAASVKTLTGKSDLVSAWDSLFRYYNQKKGKGDVGYTSGETVAVKIDTVNTYSQNKWGTGIDASGEMVLAVVDQLVASAGVPQANIVVYDGGVGTIGNYIYDCVNKVYPNIRWEAANAWGNVKACTWVDNGIKYSSMDVSDADAHRVAHSIWDATYSINLALLKKHEDQTAVTLCGKNHFGSIKNCRAIHATINDQTKGMKTYNSLVDLNGHEKIGAKTILYIVEGLWGSAGISGSPVKWNTAPFNGDWPSSIFMSQDFVAIDSVCLDFLNSEFTLWDNGDNYLHEAALANDPPSGIVYDPEGDGTRLPSLGVHEHWNNAQSKQYSRNLGTGSGIELVTVGSIQPTPTPTGIGLLGDVNNSGKVDITDALLVAQYSAGMEPASFNAANADVNRDNQISILDALQIARLSASLITGF